MTSGYPEAPLDTGPAQDDHISEESGQNVDTDAQLEAGPEHPIPMQPEPLSETEITQDALHPATVAETGNEEQEKSGDPHVKRDAMPLRLKNPLKPGSKDLGEQDQRYFPRPRLRSSLSSAYACHKSFRYVSHVVIDS